MPLRRDVRLLGEVLGRPAATDEEREAVRRPLLRSIAGIDAGLRNTP